MVKRTGIKIAIKIKTTIPKNIIVFLSVFLFLTPIIILFSSIIFFSFNISYIYIINQIYYFVSSCEWSLITKLMIIPKIIATAVPEIETI